MEQYAITFNIFITNVGSGAESTLSKFGDDIKWGEIVKHPDRRASVQSRGKGWQDCLEVQQWQISMLQLGQSNSAHKYSQGTDLLGKNFAKRNYLSWW